MGEREDQKRMNEAVTPAPILDERDRYREALEVIAERDNWSGDPLKLGSYMYGHDTPFEIARTALASSTGDGDV